MRKEQQAALQHALDALSDGAGHEVWGPGPVGEKLWNNHYCYAALAFDQAASTLFALQSSSSRIALTERAVYIANMKKLAPVMLDILLPPEQ